MKMTLEQIYNNNFFEKRARLYWRAPIVCKAIIAILNPYSVLDIGAGGFEFVSYFLSVGIRAIGIEGSSQCLPYITVPKKNIIIQDISVKCPPLPFVDLTISFEVFEHIGENFVDVMLSTVCLTSNALLISAAPPGQKGIGHINCKEQSYWIDKLGEKGFVYKQYMVNSVKNLLEPYSTKKELRAIYNNMMYFEK